MKTVQIHHQTAKKILRKFSYLIDIYGADDLYHRIKKGENHLLKTGAKMFCEKGKVFVSGYAMDNSDTDKLFC